jgi:predicted ATPase
MIGTVFDGRYRIEAELGRGGMGIVYRAHDTLLDRDVAVKLLSESGLGTQGRARLLHEARAAARLNHPNIIAVYDAGEAGGFAFVIMELLEGASLYKQRPRSLDEILAVARQICRALEHAHSHGIVHRDLKPENVIVTPSGLTKLTDFGLARSVASRLTQDGLLSGTVYYLAPEQALGKTIDGRTDLYALGVLLYELTTGQLPFTADDPLAVISQHLHAPPVCPSTYAASLPDAIDDLILRLMSKSPDDRPPTAAAVLQALDELGGPERRAALPAPIDRLATGRLVGREREFGEARALWQQVLAGSGEVRVLLISGEPGVGKSPLVREIRSLAEITGGQILAGECYAEGSAPYTPVAQVIRSGLALPQAEVPAAVAADLITLAPDLRASVPAQSAPPLLDETSGATNLAPNLGLSAAGEQTRLFESFVMFVSQLAARAPMLVVVEDIQWADSGSLYLLRHLARRSRTANLRLLMVLTYRDVEVADACCLQDVLLDLQRERLSARIKLGRLDRDQTRQVLETKFREPLTPELVEAIYRETEGNLFFIEEVCKALIEDGQLVHEDGGWRVAFDLAQLRVPQSVRETIQSRVGKLPAQAQEVLRLAAVLGREFDFALLHAAGEWDEDALIEALEAAERAQLVAEVPTASGRETFAFAHALIPTSLREGLGGLRRRRLHRRVAAALEKLRPDDYAALAYHADEAGDDEQAQRYFRRAGERAAAMYANEDAVQAYTAALELMGDEDPERFGVLSARAKVHDLMARRDAQRADVEAMLALAETLADDARRCDALIAQADYYLATTYDQARGPAERAVALARRLGDPVRAGHALRRVGEQAWVTRELDESRAALEAAAQRFLYAGLSGGAAACLHMLSLVLGSQGLGDFAASQSAATQAVTLSRQAADRLQEAHSLRRLAIAYLDQRRPAEALTVAEQALGLHREMGDRAGEARALGVLGVVFACLRRPAEAEQHFYAAVDLFEQLGASEGVVDALGDFSEVVFQPLGRHTTELALLDEHVARAQAAGNEYLVGSLQFQRAQVLARLGQFVAAREALELPVVSGPNRLGPSVRAAVRVLLGRLQTELGEYVEANAVLSDLLAAQAGRPVRPVETADNLLALAENCLRQDTAEAWRAGLPHAQQAVSVLTNSAWDYALGHALVVQAQLQLALGNADAALVDTSAALALAQAWPGVPERLLYVHALTLRASGRLLEARDYLGQAHAHIQQTAAQIADPQLRRSWLENVWLNRHVLADWALYGA